MSIHTHAARSRPINLMTQLPDTNGIERLGIVHYPDPALRRAGAPIARFDDRLLGLARRMCALMHEHNGVGLAAPQVGLALRLFVWNPTGQPEDDQVCVNPRLSAHTEPVESEEGCLSLPSVTVQVRRARTVHLDAQDCAGNDVALDGADLVARIWQHEVDHLDGKLIIDYMSPSDAIANRRAIKDMESQYKRAHSRR